MTIVPDESCAALASCNSSLQKMTRLAFALISVLAHAVAHETRITDPAAAASAENAQLYELIKAEYLAEACDPRR